jgi:hypothetical protein
MQLQLWQPPFIYLPLLGRCYGSNTEWTSFATTTTAAATKKCFFAFAPKALQALTAHNG